MPETINPDLSLRDSGLRFLERRGRGHRGTLKGRIPTRHPTRDGPNGQVNGVIRIYAPHRQEAAPRHSLANAASLERRSGLSPAATSRAPATSAAVKRRLRRGRPPATPDPAYFLVQFADDEEPEPAAFAFFASRFSFSDLLAAVFELFEPPLSLLAMVTSSRRRTGC